MYWQSSRFKNSSFKYISVLGTIEEEEEVEPDTVLDVTNCTCESDRCKKHYLCYLCSN